MKQVLIHDNPGDGGWKLILDALKELDMQVKWLVDLCQVQQSHDLEQAAIRAKRQAHKLSDFPDWVKEWVWEELRGRCANPRCRVQCDILAPPGADTRPVYDHIIPRSCGGRGTIENCQLTCNLCNSQKGGCRNGQCHHEDYRPVDMKRAAAKIALCRSLRYKPLEGLTDQIELL